MVKTLVPQPLKWHGGKGYLAKWIISLMPPHVHYVEPFFGGGAVLLEKEPEGVSEVVNDVNAELSNFCARDSRSARIRKVSAACRMHAILRERIQPAD